MGEGHGQHGLECEVLDRKLALLEAEF